MRQSSKEELMFHFFRVGNPAARNQFLAATTISIVAIVVTGNPSLIGVSFSPNGAQAVIDATRLWYTTYQFVAWSDVVFAAGFSLTCAGGFDVTVQNMKRAAQQISSQEPKRPLKVLVSLLCLSAVLGGILALQPPPSWFVQSHAIDAEGLALACIWPGLTSTAVAYFGSNARAAIRALG
jgi:hypothetical protein